MNREWYKDAVFYQIWPRSFKDGNGDGIGDLWGVYEKLDYIKSLGVGGIWFSPLYASPNADFGYDISDYYQISPDYGDLEIFDKVLQKAHEPGPARDHGPGHQPHLRRARVVPEEPPWHRALHRLVHLARWQDAPRGRRQAPNNWEGLFEGEGWQWDDVAATSGTCTYLPRASPT